MFHSFINSSQIEEQIIQTVGGHAMQGISDQECQLVSVLTDHGDPDCPGPVVVQVGQLVAQPLDVLRLQARRVPDHVVRGRVHRPLPHRLGHQEKVKPGETNNRNTRQETK